jgi:hypothetical protein
VEVAVLKFRFSVLHVLLFACAAALPGGLAAATQDVVALAAANCSSPPNAIVAENCMPGNPASEWDISGAGDSTIQGFATDISVNQGDTINFKVKTTASSFRLDIYRMGYYGGNGARKITTINAAGKNQPNCLTDSPTGLIDCGNWSVSASWTVPANATSGIYFARAVRTDNGGASHIFFVVRADSSQSDILFQTSDPTWQAYNDYGGNNLYTGGPGTNPSRAYKVSYNRPFHTRVFEPESWVFNAEYPMIRWLEANGYDVSYFSSIDTERNSALIRNHKVWMSNGHDEYVSAGQRAGIQAARDAGVHLAFFSGNTMFWKTRWENSMDGSNTPFRTLVCYKETHANAVIDPADPPVWTGTWRDPRFSPPADGGKPENALVGTLFRMNGGQNAAITVPQTDGRMRIWRNTSVATLGTGQIATLAPGTIGAEFDDDEDNGFRPAGLIELSNTPIADSSNVLQDYGSTYGSGTVVHKVTLYRAPSGAWVFATGTYQWSWGLDSNHDRSNLGGSTDIRMQQATVNLFADMGVQPASLQAGLIIATASTDTTPPGSAITAPAAGSDLAVGTAFTITGTATDNGGGVVAGVEVSVDGGTTWQAANGRSNWSYSWTPRAPGSVTIKSRAVDDSGNLEVPNAGVAVTVGGGGSTCSSSCTIWPTTTTPSISDAGPDSAVEVGLKFRADASGTITAIRFYKAPTNTGVHVGSLWSSTGQLLAAATFSGETASGWQQVSLSTPVAITANTVYVVSYHTNGGHYADDEGYFATRGFDNGQLHALQDGISGVNGVYAYGSTSIFPTQGFNSSNYWVDVVFAVGNAPSLASITVTPANPTIATGGTQQFTATGRYSDNSTQNITGQVTWASSATAVATINSAGLASGVGAGSTTISASQGQVTGSTTLTVTSAPPPPLSVTAMTPANNATGVNAGTTVSATFNNALNASTVTSSTFTLTGPNNTPVSGTYSVSGSTATLTPAAALAASTTYAATLTTGIKDVNGSSLASNSTWSFTTAAVAAGCTSNCTIWPSTATPATPDDGPDNPVELGMKFRADSDGTVSAIRFYKASTNTGAHVGHLWSSTGQLLATATFTGETASGWQQVILSPAVPIAANTVYVVSYHTTVGHYADDQNFFATAGVDNPPLHALQNGVSGVNGVYAYGSGTFPNQGFNASNYWVDVVFSAGNIANTGFLAPTANAPVTTGAGDNNGYQTTPANAYALDALLAVDPNSGTGTGTSCTATSKDKHDFYTFNVSLPAGASIRGIEVQLNAKADSTSNSPKICVQLSWDGGTTWTAAQTTATLTTSTAAYNLGGAANNWGRTWAATDFSNPAFRVRLIDVASSTARTFSLDALAVRISYQ